MNIFTSEGAHIDDILEKDGVIASVTCGASMRPLFKTHRDMVVLKKASGVLKKYDVALYKVNSRYILHRIIKVLPQKGYYIIRGDNTYRKEIVPIASVIAYLDSFNRNGKHHSTKDFSYRTYSVLWNAIYPIRFVIHASLSVCRKVYHKLKIS